MLGRQPTEHDLIPSNQIVHRQLNYSSLVKSKSAVTHDFQEGKEVYAKSFSSQAPHWLTGHITKLTGPVSILRMIYSTAGRWFFGKTIL